MARSLSASLGSGKDWAEVCEQANVPATRDAEYNPEVVHFGLRGYAWERPVPWTDPGR